LAQSDNHDLCIAIIPCIISGDTAYPSSNKTRTLPTPGQQQQQQPTLLHTTLSTSTSVEKRKVKEDGEKQKGK